VSPEAIIIILLLSCRFIFGSTLLSQIDGHAEVLQAKVFQNKHLDSVKNLEKTTTKNMFILILISDTNRSRSLSFLTQSVALQCFMLNVMV